MSLTITTDVFCDAPDCLAWIGGTTGARTDALGARRAAKMHGWVRRNRKDLCPEHADSGPVAPMEPSEHVVLVFGPTDGQP